MAVHARNGVEIIVTGGLSGYTVHGGELINDNRFDWVETLVDTSIVSNTASNQYTASFRFINSGETAVVSWGDGTTDTYSYLDGKSRVHTYSSPGTYRVRYGKVRGALTTIPYGTLSDDEEKKIDITRCGQYSGVPWTLHACARMTLSGTTFSATDSPDVNAVAGTTGLTYSSAFQSVTELETVPSTFNLSGYSGSVSRIFASCTSLNDDVSGVFTGATATNCEGMFNSCVAFNNGGQPFSITLASSGVRMDRMFQSCSVFNSPVTNLVTSAVDRTDFMFNSALIFDQDISSWDMSNVTVAIQMMDRARAFNNGGQPLIWDLSSMSDASYMFQDMNAFNQQLTLTNFAPTIVRNLLTRCTVFNNGFASGASNGSAGTGMDTWDLSGVTDMQLLFNRCFAFNSYIGSWNTSGVTNMAGVFNTASNFNQDVGGWNTSSATNMASMFQSATQFNNGGVGGIGVGLDTWDTASVTNMSYMFRTASNFNQYIGSWNTGSVTGMSYMFENCPVFNQDISGWNVSSVTNFQKFFSKCFVFDQDLSSWNTANVTNMSYMFESCSALRTGNGGATASWSIASLVNANQMWGGSPTNPLTTANYDAILDSTTGWPSQATIQNNVTFAAAGATYTGGSNAETGRNILTGTYGWTISDAGPV